MKRQKDMLPEDEPLRSVGVQYATGEEQRNSSRKTKEAGQSRNDTQLWMCLVVNKVQCYKEQYCIETRNVRSMNQGTLDVIKQEMARVNTDILGISELKWTRWENLIQMTIISTTMGKNCLEEME